MKGYMVTTYAGEEAEDAPKGKENMLERSRSSLG